MPQQEPTQGAAATGATPSLPQPRSSVAPEPEVLHPPSSGAPSRQPRVLRAGGEVSRVVAAGPEALYALVADVERIGEWHPECRGCAWRDGVTEARVGARFVGRNFFGMTRWARTCEVVTVDPGREFAFRTTSARLYTDSTTWRYRFEPVDGGTRVTESYEFTLAMPPALERFCSLLLPQHKDMRPSMAATLDRIATAAEGLADVPQMSLPGQVAAPPGPIDLSGTYLMHHAFRRDLADSRATVAGTPIGETETWQALALARRWHRMAHVLHKHHQAEDAGLWPLLLRRTRAAGDDEGTAALLAMEEEHAGVGPLLGACGRMLVRLAATPDEALRAKLVAAVERIDDGLRAHLAHEERDAMALVQRHLSPADWQRFDEEYVAREDKPWDIPFALCWVLHQLPADAQEFVFALPAAPPRRVHDLLRAKFKWPEAATFRFATT